MVPFRGKRVLKWNIDIHPSKTSNLCLLRVDSFVVDDVHALTVEKNINNQKKLKKKYFRENISLSILSIFLCGIFIYFGHSAKAINYCLTTNVTIVIHRKIGLSVVVVVFVPDLKLWMDGMMCWYLHLEQLNVRKEFMTQQNINTYYL